MKEKLNLLLKDWQPKHTVWAATAVVSGFIAFYWDQTRPVAETAQAEERIDAAATYIPAGYVLVPIEIANFESLDSILGKHGVVDLYAPAHEPGGKSTLVAEKVKILRAPLNPNLFAVLVPEEESPRLVTMTGPFTVVVQNPGRTGTKFVRSEGVPAHKPKLKRVRSRIEVEVQSTNEEADAN